MRGAGDRMGDAHIAMAMEVSAEVGTAATPITTGIFITARLEPKERNENRTTRWRSNTPAAAGIPRDWRSCVAVNE